MLSDGQLMRLGKEDFSELILDHVLQNIDLDAARAQVDDGAVWLDIRYPEEHAELALPSSENIPLNLLRLQSNRLRKDFRYIVCGDDVEQCAIAAFLLGERGFDVTYLDTTVARVAETQPTFVVRHLPLPAARPKGAQVVNFPGAEIAGAPNSDHEPMEEDNDNGPLESTITRIAGLYTNEEAQREMNDTTPVDKYADTATGRELADMIEELGEQHDNLAQPESGDGEDSEMDRDDRGRPQRGAYPLDPGALPGDGIATVMREMEDKIRNQVALAVEAQRSDLQADYQRKLTRMRELTNQEVQQKEVAIRRDLESQYTEKEQLLRSYYKKLIALANKISRQKAQLQEARKQFEVKLSSANRLYREVEEMRELLADHIGYLDREAIEEIPGLSISL
jgi:rhodanese-related sulfurtransferase